MSKYIMSKGEFLYKFLIKYNSFDCTKKSTSKDFWFSYGIKGQFIYYLRNILVHELKDQKQLNEIKDRFGYNNIINIFGELNDFVTDEQKINYINYIADNYEDYFKSRGYIRQEYNQYYYFQKETNIEGLKYNIFVYDNSDFKTGFISLGVHTYSHEKGEKSKIYIDDEELQVYVHSESNGYILINYYKLDKDSPIGLELNNNDENYRIILPRLHKYSGIRKKLSLGEETSYNLTKKEFHKVVNKLYGKDSKKVRMIIKEIECAFMNMKNDLSDINLA